MKIKTSELTGTALDWAVAKAAGQTYHGPAWTKPSTDWAQGGPIIEREKIAAVYRAGRYWLAYTHENYQGRQADACGPTPLIAAMRCYVASKLGDEVDVPDDWLKGMELDDLIYDRGDE